jgi:outer membrane protein assembly factor BamE
MVLRIIFLSLGFSLLTACSSDTLFKVVKPFRIDVRQGNYVSQEMLSQLTPGMTREQVRFIMGSPLLVDVFHADRWDYIYRFSGSAKDKEPDLRRIALFFANDKLSRVDGDVIAGSGSGSTSDAPTVPRVIDITGPAASEPVSSK